MLVHAMKDLRESHSNPVNVLQRYSSDRGGSEVQAMISVTEVRGSQIDFYFPHQLGVQYNLPPLAVPPFGEYPVEVKIILNVPLSEIL